MHLTERIETIDTHTEAESTKIIKNLIGKTPGNNTIEKMHYFKKHFDNIRTLLLAEPRGHKDMYGCLLTHPSQEGADYGLIFMEGGI